MQAEACRQGISCKWSWVTSSLPCSNICKGLPASQQVQIVFAGCQADVLLQQGPILLQGLRRSYRFFHYISGLLPAGSKIMQDGKSQIRPHSLERQRQQVLSTRIRCKHTDREGLCDVVALFGDDVTIRALEVESLLDSCCSG